MFYFCAALDGSLNVTVYIDIDRKDFRKVLLGRFCNGDLTSSF